MPELRRNIEKAEAQIKEGKLGKGLDVPMKKSDAPRDPSQYKRFGPRFFINTKKLKNGEFSLCHPSGQKPNIIRNAKLTPALKEVVQNVPDGAPNDTSHLTPQEMEWYRYIWDECKLAPAKPDLPIRPKRYLTMKSAKQRAKVLVGEVVAGNDSPLIIKELEELVQAMDMRGWLGADELAKLRVFISGRETP
jgi:hypothetical protein